MAKSAGEGSGTFPTYAGTGYSKETQAYMGSFDMI